jgi:hypothetical protein
MGDKFGVVKAADKNEKIEKSARPKQAPKQAPKPAGDNMLRDELVKAEGLQDDVVKAGLVKPKKEKKPVEKKEPAEKKEDPLKQRLAKRLEGMKKQHPDLPAELITKIKECQSCGAAKRLLRDHLRGAGQ